MSRNDVYFPYYLILFDPSQANPDTLSEGAPLQATVGLVLGAHGVRGEVRVRVLSDVPHRFDPGQTLFIQGQEYPILSSSSARAGTVILKLAGIDTPAAARALSGQEMTAVADGAPGLEEGEYFHYQLMGMRVYTEEGEDLGRIAEIIITGSNDVYVVAGDKGEILLPALAQVIRRVDITQGIMTVRLMDGLR